jgi:anti-sigma factor RsiW
MGKRSRKRTGSSAVADESPQAVPDGTSRAERDAARARRVQSQRRELAAKAERTSSGKMTRSERRRRAGRPTIDERPPAPWGSFPLVELLVFAALVMLIVGALFTDGDLRRRLVLAALAIGSLAGLEVSVREHFAGYRSHTAILAGVIAFASMMVVAIVAGKIQLGVVVIVGVLAFGVAFWLFREAFKRRSGGLGFR